MENSQTSRIAIVTGGSSGIGKAIAERLEAGGVKVIVADKTPPENAGPGIFRKCDVTKGEDIDRLYAWVAENAGKPDILVLNAGQGIREKLSEGDPAKWQEIINTNLMGPLRCIRSFVPDMEKADKGNVVFISSVSANQPHPYGGIYCASKTALEVIAETLRLETLPHVKVTVVSPGVVDTPFFRNQLSGSGSIDEIGVGAIGPEEIAEDVWYILQKSPGTSINKIVTRPSMQEF